MALEVWDFEPINTCIFMYSCMLLGPVHEIRNPLFDVAGVIQALCQAFNRTLQREWYKTLNPEWGHGELLTLDVMDPALHSLMPKHLVKKCKGVQPMHFLTAYCGVFGAFFSLLAFGNNVLWCDLGTRH